MGLRFVAVMPEGVSNERVKMIRAYGGAVRLCPAESGMGGCIALTEEIARNEGAYLPVSLITLTMPKLTGVALRMRSWRKFWPFCRGCGQWGRDRGDFGRFVQGISGI